MKHTQKSNIYIEILHTGDDTNSIEIYGTYFYVNIVYWTIASIYSYFDVTNTPKFLRKYKVQPGTNEPIDPKRFKNLVWTVFINQTVIFFPLVHLGIKAHNWRGRPDIQILPEFHHVILGIISHKISLVTIFDHKHLCK